MRYGTGGGAICMPPLLFAVFVYVSSVCGRIAVRMFPFSGPGRLRRRDMRASWFSPKRDSNTTHSAVVGDGGEQHNVSAAVVVCSASERGAPRCRAVVRCGADRSAWENFV